MMDHLTDTTKMVRTACDGEAWEVVTLTAESSRAVLERLDATPAPTPALRALMLKRRPHLEEEEG